MVLRRIGPRISRMERCKSNLTRHKKHKLAEIIESINCHPLGVLRATEFDAYCSAGGLRCKGGPRSLVHYECGPRSLVHYERRITESGAWLPLRGRRSGARIGRGAWLGAWLMRLAGCCCEQINVLDIPIVNGRHHTSLRAWLHLRWRYAPACLRFELSNAADTVHFATCLHHSCFPTVPHPTCR